MNMMLKGRKKYRLSLLWALIVFLHVATGVKCSPDSRGREFVVSFMENQSNHGPNLKFVDIFISTASVTNVTVKISAPRLSSAKLNETFNVAFGKIKHLKLDYIVVNVGSKRSSKGLLITATDEIIVFGINKQESSTDGFLAFPTDVLGHTHYAVCFSYDRNKYYTSDIVVVGVENNTELTIKLSGNDRVKIDFEGNTYHHNNWINLTLNAYDTLQLETKGDLTGSFIQADKPIAVFTGNKRTDLHVGGRGSGGRDHLVEQIPPTVTWGKHFATVPFPERRDGYVLRFVASEDTTSISIVGCVTKNFTLNTGSFRQENIPNSGCFLIIRSSKPILVAQFSKSSDGSMLSDPSMFIVPPIEQYAADYVISSPPATSGPFINYFLIVVKASEKDGLIIDGKNIQNVNASFKQIQGTDLVGGYVYVGKDTEAHTIKHRSPISVFGAVAYGGAVWESYSFPLGLRLAPINQMCKNTKMTVADGIDNDCDRHIDEEICNGKDEDGDANIDEDCAASDPTFTTTASKPSPSTHQSMAIIATSSPRTSKPSISNHKTISLTTSSPTTSSSHTTYSSATSVDPKSKTTFSTTTMPYYHTNHLTQEAANKSSHRRQLHTSSATRKKRKTIWVLPSWLKTLEAIILGTISCVIVGASLCLCKRLFVVTGRRNENDDEEERLTIWQKKKRPLPFQRKH